MQKQYSEGDRNLNKRVGGYQIEDFLGKGAFGRVYKAIQVQTSKIRAIKIIPRHLMAKKKAVTSLERELNALDQVKDPNVLNLHDYFMTKTNYYVVLDYCNGGDLSDYIDANDFKNHKRVGECVARSIIKQICQGLKGIFDKGYVHRDIKLPNILLHFKDSRNPSLKDATVKIGDLGFARPITKEQWAVSQVGTPLTMAPEVILKGKKYNQQVDVWAIGVISFQLVVGYLPFIAEDLKKFKHVVEQGEFKIPEKLHLSTLCLHFINKCLQFDPEKRMHFSEILEHKWFSVSDEELLAQVKEMDQKANKNWLKISTLHSPSEEELKEENLIVLNSKEMKNLDEKYRKELNRGIDHLNSVILEQQEDDQIPENKCTYVNYDSESEEEEDSQNTSPLQSTLKITV